jgi:ferric-dicitrate binding protein FerR (iron transport regulator)
VHTLSEAERLQLEHHLSECEACRELSTMSRTISDVIRAAPKSLTESARERAIAGAFERAARALPVPRAAEWAPRAGFVVAAAALLLLGVRVWRVEPERGELATSTTLEATKQPALRGAGSAAAVPDNEAPRSLEDAWLESTSGDTRQFAGAHVRLAPGTRLRFARKTNTLELSAGEVTLDVEHQHERPFAVLTQGFRVEVLGTQFVVSPEHVTVLRGHVQVRERASDALIADLLTGQSYRRPPVTAGPNASVIASAPAQDRIRTQQATRTSSRRHVSDGASTPMSSATGTASAHKPSVAELIVQARSALADADVSQARALVQRAEQAAEHVGERAEVGTLLAECELLARRPDAAVRAYLRVADRFASLSAGENALFAAAQLQLRERDTSAAHKLFERYLARYPQGRFADEARAHLAAAP